MTTARYNRGSVLIVALVFLLLLTIAGVSAMRLVRLDVQATGATIERSYATQASEAALIEAEEFVHQQFADFESIQFFDTIAEYNTFNVDQAGTGNECRPLVANGSICFVEQACVNGYCMPGQYDANARTDMVTALADDPNATVGAEYIYPIGASPTQLADDFPDVDTRQNTIDSRLLTAKTTRFWETEANFTNSSLVASVSVPVTDTNGFTVSTADEEYAVSYIVEFVGFNLAPGANVAQATQAANLPPSASWLMTYRVTAMINPKADRLGNSETIFDDSRTMVQALYTRRMPASIPMVVGVRNAYITTGNASGTGGFTSTDVKYGCPISSSVADWNSSLCRFTEDVAPVAANQYKIGTPVLAAGNILDYHDPIDDPATSAERDTLVRSISRDARDGSDRDFAINLPAMSNDEYFELYFEGASKKEIYEAAYDTANRSVVKIDLSALNAGGCTDGTFSEADIAAANIVVLEGSLNIDGSTDHPLAACDFARESKVLITGNLDYTGNIGPTDTNSLNATPPTDPTDAVGSPPWEVGLIYSMGKSTWGVDPVTGDYFDTPITHTLPSASGPVNKPSKFSGSNWIYSMLAFEEDLSLHTSLNVLPQFPIGGSTSQVANQSRSRYAWRELDFPF